MLITDRRDSTHSALLAARGVVNFPSFLPKAYGNLSQHSTLQWAMNAAVDLTNTPEAYNELAARPSTALGQLRFCHSQYITDVSKILMKDRRRAHDAKCIYMLPIHEQCSDIIGTNFSTKVPSVIQEQINDDELAS